jgi:hypothetical protein
MLEDHRFGHHSEDEEELLAEMSHLPELSANLRSRVLAAALEARARRAQGRQVLGSALVLFCLVGWVTWSRPHSTDARHTAEAIPAGPAEPSDVRSPTAGEPALPALLPSSTYCRRDMLISAMGDDWRMVEAEFKSREEFTRRVHM